MTIKIPARSKKASRKKQQAQVLAEPQHYANRELGLLEFNQRVLAQAEDARIPILERLRFLCISCTNLDEFFEIRVSGLRQREEINALPPGPDLLSAKEVLSMIAERTHALVKQQYELLNAEIFPALDKAGISFARRDHWNAKQKKWLSQHFHEQILPVLTPLTLDPSRPFPQLLNKSLNFIVALEGVDVYGRPRHRALVQAPRSLPRLIRLPESVAGKGKEQYVFLSAIIHTYVTELFAGMQVNGCYQFRVTRNSDLYVDDEEVDDLVRALEGELAASRYGAAVRLEVASECPDELSTYLLDHFKLEQGDLYRVDGPVNLNRLMMLADNSPRHDLKYPPFTPGIPKALLENDSIFAAMRKKDILLHHPFQSFSPVIDMLAQSAADPQVLAIKQTLYRTGADSPVVDHLVTAARAGKEVTVVVELMARFDEEANIALATRLQEAGAHVVFGVVGYKTHAKMLLIVRRENDQLKRYVHLGTGNYHPRTTRHYTDYGLFSASADLGDDVHQVFMQLTSLTKIDALRQLVTSPFDLHKHLIKLIRVEKANAEKGEAARIVAKINSLIEPEIIRELYDASSAGVKIDLIVRGICSLRPGVKGLSENIRVRSIIGRFLEHSRIYYFLNGGKEIVQCASADWMDRNFFRRVEACFPLQRNSHVQRIIKDLELYLADNEEAWLMRQDGSYQRVKRGVNDPSIGAQETLLSVYADNYVQQQVAAKESKE